MCGPPFTNSEFTMADTDPNTCPTCNGSGEYPEGTICSECLGRSTVPIKGLSFKMFKEQRERFSDLSDKVDDALDKVDDALDKLDDILEQLSE